MTKNDKVLLGLSIGLGLAGFAVLKFGLLYSTPWVIAVGESLIVAAILGLTIDWYVKERVAKGMLLDAAKYLIGYGLPPEIQARIRDLMLVTMVRHDAIYRYKLNTTNPRIPSVTVEYEFSVVNYGPAPAPYEHVVSLEKRDKPRMIRMTCQSSDKDVEFTVEGSGLRQEEKADVIRFKAPEVRLNSQGGNPRHWYRFVGSYQVSPIGNTEILAFGTPVQGIIIEAEYPEGWCFESASMSEPSSHQDNGSGYSIWRFDQGFLRAEHLRFFWYQLDP